MRLIIVLSLITFYCVRSYAINWEPDTVRLNNAYTRLMENPNSKEAQTLFFDSFPSTWLELEMTYGSWRKYDLSANTGSIADPYEYGYRTDLDNLNNKYEHIEALQDNMNLISDSIYCRKITNIAVNGRIQDSLPGALQDVVRAAMKIRKAWMWKTISRLTPSDQLSFWMFFWGNIIFDPNRIQEYDELYNELSIEYPKEANVMRIGFENGYGKTWFDGPDRSFMRYMWEGACEAK